MADVDLERALRALAAEVVWPTAPEPRLPAPAPRRARSPVRPLTVALAAAALAAAVTLLVPGARSAVLRFFHLGGVTVERVRTLPRLPEPPLTASLGRRVSAGEAEQALGTPMRLPRERRPARLYLSGPVVSTLIPTRQGDVLLSEFRAFPASIFVKKAATPGTRVESVLVRRHLVGFWLSGAPHELLAPSLPPRLAGNTLLWDRGGVTYRLERRGLRLPLALQLARKLTP